ncbi:MAG TPA: DUF2520 domain-containing protein [Bacteroidales bacterium]|nr:DUF2520 domain-containing protein [Bacteroidales bacterium]
MAIQKVVIVGSGNVATHLALAFKNSGLEILGVYSRRAIHAQELANRLGAKTYSKISDIPKNADAYLFAVSDSALEELINQFDSFAGIHFHTSGSIGLNVFSNPLMKAGVFYPLQTFSKEKAIDFSTIPLLLESTDETVLNELHSLALKLSKTVKMIDSEQRKQLHLAAVFACNFSNYMLFIASELLKENNLDFELLKPLIKETIEKLDRLSPAEAQTGPAIRKDWPTIENQINQLSEHSDYQQIYRLLSNHIMKLKS